MASFPASIVSPTDPQSTDKFNNPSHSSQHQSHNAEIVAIESKVGTGSSTPSTDTFLIGNGSGTSAWSSLTSAQLRARISDETGTGVAVFATTPTLVTPVLGAATGTSLALGGGTALTTTNQTGTGNLVLASSPTLTTPVIADYTSATHTHASTAQGGLLNGANAISDGTVTPAELKSGAGSTWVWQTFAPAATGFSSLTSDTGRYIQIGNTVFGLININGTSNAVSLTFTLPVAAKAADDYGGMRVANNGAFLTTPGYIEFAASSTLATCYSNGGAGAWTNVNAKVFFGYFFYEAA